MSWNGQPSTLISTYYEPGGVTVNSKVRDYNYDLWSGIEYRLDVTKPVGSRVVELKLNGEYLAMDQVVRVALNNYRATGKFPTAPKLYQSTVEVRELITNWIMERGTISPSDVFVQNFTLMPPVNTWLPARPQPIPVTRWDYANCFGQPLRVTADDYYDSSPLQRLEACKYANPRRKFLHSGNVAMAGPAAHETLTRRFLSAYTESSRLLGWAKAAIRLYLIQTGIFVPVNNQLLPKQTVTNAEALAWIREARYPLFTFLSTNDFHGQLETGKLVSSKLVGGAAFNMTYINNYKALNPLGTSLFDAGDIMQGTPISNLLLGESVIDVYNHMGYQAAVVGNHEFDWGLTRLQERMEQADFPILAGQCLQGRHRYPSQLDGPDRDALGQGQHIGVIGVTSKDTPTIVMAGNTAGLEFREPGPVVEELATELRDAGADIIVVLAHMPDVYNDVVSGEMVTVAIPGVDLIISGHSHNSYADKINGVPIIQQYSSGTAIGVSDLRYDRVYDNIANSKLQVVTTYNEGVTPDAEIAAIVADYQVEIAPIVNAVKAKTLGDNFPRTGSLHGRSAHGRPYRGCATVEGWHPDRLHESWWNSGRYHLPNLSARHHLW